VPLPAYIFPPIFSLYVGHVVSHIAAGDVISDPGFFALITDDILLFIARDDLRAILQ
jgi:hypothetical protein